MVAIGIRRTLLVLVAITGAAASRPAAATPYIDVRSIWGAFFVPGLDLGTGTVNPSELPPGLTITCGGDSAINANGCLASLSVNHTVTSNETSTASAFGTLTLKNTGTTPFTGSLIFPIDFSAFNPGGPEVGISIDNTSQSASFSSQVLGGGGTPASRIFSGEPSDQHSCSLPASQLGFTGGGYNFSALQCGVQAPDESVAFVLLGPLSPGQSESLFGELSITDTFSVPEPSVLGIMAPGLLALGLLCRRRRGQPQLDA